MMKTGPIDVEAVLLNARQVRRRPGHVPYPLEPSNDIVNMDNWNQMFIQHCCKRITLHPFETAPLMVLDLGCGSGYWAVEASKQWTNSTIIGFDLKQTQRTHEALSQDAELSSRVKWVYGNLLERLPFSSEHFDFVRIVGLGLAVPEDEWQDVFEEVSRVMKPGAILEIFEEDLIFPCVPLLPKRKQLAPLTVNLPIGHSPSSPSSVTTASTITSDHWKLESPSEHNQPSVIKKPNRTPLQESPRSSYSRLNSFTNYAASTHTASTHTASTHTASTHTSSTIVEPESYSRIGSYAASTYTATTIVEPESYSRVGSFTNYTAPATTIAEPDDEPSGNDSHPMDHTRLSRSWDAMLASRFIAPNVITVLPFYLSSCFSDVQSHPTLNVPLPASKRTATEAALTFDPDLQFKLAPYGRSSAEGDKLSSPSSEPSSCSIFTTMHLAKTVRTIMACKEPIWKEYKELYTSEAVPRVVNTSRPTSQSLPISQSLRDSSVREDFDRSWTNWENDMLDRMGMRERIIDDIQWEEPVGDRPEYHAWMEHSSGLTNVSSANETPLARSIRGFVSRKAL